MQVERCLLSRATRRPFAPFNGRGGAYRDHVGAWQTVEAADGFTATALLYFAFSTAPQSTRTGWAYQTVGRALSSPAAGASIAGPCGRGSGRLGLHFEFGAELGVVELFDEGGRLGELRHVAEPTPCRVALRTCSLRTCSFRL